MPASSVSVMGRMIGDLLDYTRTRLGAGMPVSPAPMDLGDTCQEVYDEYRSSFPNRLIRFESTGDHAGPIIGAGNTPVPDPQRSWL